MRIVSLIPAATEIVCALGLREALVGRSHACDFPADVAGVPVMTYSTLGVNLCPDDPPMRAADLDAHITAMAQQGRSAWGLNLDALEAARPDLILTRELFEVSAVSYGEVREAVRGLSVRWDGHRPKVLLLDPACLEDIFSTISAVGHLTEKNGEADAVVGNLRARVDKLARMWVTASHKPTVAALTWLDPLYAPGGWVPEQVAAAGGSPVLGEVGQPARQIEWEEVLAAQPEMVVCLPRDCDLSASLAQFDEVAGRAEWKELPAPYLNQLICVDAAAYFSRPGPRVVDGMELLAGLLHPDQVTPPDGSRALRVRAFPLDEFIHGLPT